MKLRHALFLAPFLAVTPAFAGGDECPHGEGKKGGFLFKMMDENDDGKVTKEEFSAANEKRFAKVDANKDGSIDEAEQKASFEKWHGKKGEKHEKDEAKS